MKLRSMAALIVSMNPKLQARQMDQPETIVREVLQAFEGQAGGRTGQAQVWLGTLGARLLPRNVILQLAAGTVRELNRR